jgi:acetyltransferase-like isoleucine patch superfamily enzyme
MHVKMKRVKILIYQLTIYLWNHWFTNIPFYAVRHAYFRVILRARLGRDSSLLMGVMVKAPQNIVIGDHCVINSNVLLDGRGGLVIGDNVDIAREVLIWSMTHDPRSAEHSVIKLKTVIESSTWIGARSQIMAGVLVGQGALVGAGSVVTKNVESLTIVAGVPAKPINFRENPEYVLMHKPWFE